MTNTSLLAIFFSLTFKSGMEQRKNTRLLKNMAIVIKELREAKGKSQEDVFNDTGIHIGRIETGKGNYSVSTISYLCEYFEISISNFYKKVENI